MDRYRFANLLLGTLCSVVALLALLVTDHSHRRENELLGFDAVHLLKRLDHEKLTPAQMMEKVYVDFIYEQKSIFPDFLYR